MQRFDWKVIGGVVLNILMVFFILYFVVFLILDFMAVGDIIQYNYLAPTIYTFSIAQMAITAALFLFSLYMLRQDGGAKIFLSGLVFLASPLRALLMISLGAWYFNIIYDTVVIGVASYLIYRAAKEESEKSRKAAFASLFLLYIFLLSLAVVIRDFMVYSDSLPPISFGNYLHYGIYDYLTAFFAVLLGVLAVRYYSRELSVYREMREKMKLIGEHISNERFMEAAKMCDEIMNEQREICSGDLILMYAYALHMIGENDRAAQLIENVRGAHGLKGDIYLDLGDYRMALENYEIAVRENPKDYVSWINMGKIYVELGDMENAERCFREGVKLNKKSPVGWQNLGALALVRGRYQNALEIIAEAEKHVGKR